MNSLKPFHTFQLNHYANDVVKITSVGDFKALVGKTLNTDFVLVGSGSNTLFLEDLAIPLYVNEYLGKCLFEDNDFYYIDVNSGENWHSLVSWTLEKEVYGLENLALIPGTVGAAPIQNIGAYGVEVNQFIDSVVYIDLVSGELNTLSNNECKFGYRDSIFKNELAKNSIILKVRFKFPKEWRPVLEYGELKNLEYPTPISIFNKVCSIRNSKLPDPKVIGNAGSFFKNPIVTKLERNRVIELFPSVPSYPLSDGTFKIAAGWLIDQAGLKGKEFGNIRVNPNQALVLTNHKGEAKGKDVVIAANKIIDSVYSIFGIKLEPEVRFFSKDKEVTLVDYYAG